MLPHTIEKNIQAEIIKLLEENLREYPHNFRVGKDFIHRTQKVPTVKEKKNNKMNIKLKTFMHQKVRK